MDSGSAARIVILVILLILSGFFSSAETALTTVNKHKLRALADEGNKRAKRLIKLTENQARLLSSILICNNIVNLSASSITTTLATNLFGSLGAGIATGILTFLILIFGEITPKSIASMYSEKLSFWFVDIISFTTFILTPVIYILNKISGVFYWILHIDPNKEDRSMTESELRTIVNVSHEDGVIEGDERKMITNVVDFGDSLAKDIMVPKVDMAFVSIDADYNEIVEIYLEEKYTRLPVYKDTKDNVVGILNIKDLFFYKATHNQNEFDLKSILREPFFTYEYQKTTDLMNEMRKKSITIAIVLDEYGVTAGLITLEDLIEEIIGEIRDEYDESENETIKYVGDNQYNIDGTTKLDDVNDVIGLEISSEDYDSIGGHIIELLDHIPEVNEMAIEDNIMYKVLSVEKNRIDRVLLTILPKEEEADEKNI